MGAGKSTIGKMLADRTGRKFIDTDSVIVEKTGVDIDLIFEIEGEAGFRKRESRLIEELTALDNIVLATGGGAVISSDNRNHLKQRGTVVYLQASPEQLYERTIKDKKRPLLQTVDRLGKIRELLAVREPLYMEIADEIIATDGKSVKQIVEALSREIHVKQN
jgi:shikimate kinase